MRTIFPSLVLFLVLSLGAAASFLFQHQSRPGAPLIKHPQKQHATWYHPKWHTFRSYRENKLSRLFASSFKISRQEIEQNLTSSEQRVVQVVRDTQSSVAFVTSYVNRSATAVSSLGSGSAFVVDSAVDNSCYVVTNYHVIERAYQIQEQKKQLSRYINSTLIVSKLIAASLSQNFPDATVSLRFSDSTRQEYPARIVCVWPEYDVALLHVNSTASRQTEIAWGSSSDLLTGQGLVAIGNPFGLDRTVTTGVVSSLNRRLPFTTGNTRLQTTMIQTDCAINPGNSGGPLLNYQGQVVGVNTAIITTMGGANTGIGLAVPSDAVRDMIKSKIQEDKRKHSTTRRPGYLGVQILRVNDSICWISRVRPNSPAARAGLKGMEVDSETASVAYGDAIVAVNGNEIKSFNELQQDLWSRRQGEILSVTIQQGKDPARRRVVEVRLA